MQAHGGICRSAHYTYDQVRAASLEYFDGDELAADAFARKYALKVGPGDDEYVERTPADMHARLAREFARIEARYPNPMSVNEIFSLLADVNGVDWADATLDELVEHDVGYGPVVPQGSPTSGIGNTHLWQSLSNCFVIDAPWDSYGGIFRTDEEGAQIMKRRGGVGHDVSTLRWKGAATRNAAGTSDGVALFCERFSHTTREVAQGGRRGARMLTADVRHPDILDFIRMKQDLKRVTGANVSSRLSDEFMAAARDSGEYEQRFPCDEAAWAAAAEHVKYRRRVPAAPIWDEITTAAWAYAEPGVLFWDRVLARTPADAYADLGFRTISTNPCLTGETPVAVADGRGFVSIGELAAAGLDVPVYARDKKTGHVVIRTMRNPRQTGVRVPVFKVTVEGGHSFRATANHKVPLIDGRTVTVSQLVIGDQLRIARRSEGPIVNVVHAVSSNPNHYVIVENDAGRKTEHMLVWEHAHGRIPAHHVIHHIDFDSKNNRLDNLACMHEDAHSELHAALMRGDANPMRRAATEWSPEKWEAYRLRLSVATSGELNGRHADVTNDQIRAAALELTRDLRRRFSRNEWFMCARKLGFPLWSDLRNRELGIPFKLSCWAARECGFGDHIDVDPRVLRTLCLAEKQGYDARISDDRSHVEVRRSCEGCCIDMWHDYAQREIAFCTHGCANKHLNAITDVNVRRTTSINETRAAQGAMKKSVQLTVFSGLKFALGRQPLQREWFASCRASGVPARLGTKYGFQTWPELVAAAAVHNNRVVSVEPCGEDDVYDGTVDEDHNFYIGGWEEALPGAPSSRLMISVSNCGELPLCAYDSCRLMVVNLYKFVRDRFTRAARFMWDEFRAVVRKAQRLMDDLVDLEIEAVDRIIAKVEADAEPDDVKRVELELWRKIREKAALGRRTGLGITGLGDCLAALGVKYGSQESVRWTEDIYRTLAVESYRSSCVMAQERGAFPIYDWERERDHEFLRQVREADTELDALWRAHGRRNIANTTTAPAGTTSTQTRTTSGIENVWKLVMVRRRKLSDVEVKVLEAAGRKPDFVDASGDKWQEYRVEHPAFSDWKAATGLTDPIDSPWHGATVNDVDWVSSVDMQGAAQRWVCHAISKTCNLPKDATVDVVKAVYFRAWEVGCKGITVYRDGCRDGVLLSADAPNERTTGAAPRRPRSLPCEVHHTQVTMTRPDGKPDPVTGEVPLRRMTERFLVLVGLLDGKPYEVFGGAASAVDVPRRYKAGTLVKSRRVKGVATYDLRIDVDDSDDTLVFKNVVELFDDPEGGTVTRLASLALRHGVPVQYVVEQLHKDRHSDMSSLGRVVARILKGHIPDGTSATSEKTCPECGGTKFVYREGCAGCVSCGWSRCG